MAKSYDVEEGKLPNPQNVKWCYPLPSFTVSDPFHFRAWTGLTASELCKLGETVAADVLKQWPGTPRRTLAGSSCTVMSTM